MKLKELLTEADPPADAPAAPDATAPTTDAGADAGADVAPTDPAPTNVDPNAPPVPEKDAGDDAVAPTEPQDAGGPNPIGDETADAKSPDDQDQPDKDVTDTSDKKEDDSFFSDQQYSDKINNVMTMLKEYGYNGVDYKLGEGKVSSIIVKGKMSKQDLADIQSFAKTMKIECDLTVSQIDEDRFITTINLQNKPSLKSFKDLLRAGDVGGSKASAEADAEGEPGAEGGEEPSMEGGEENPPAEGETPPEGEAPAEGEAATPAATTEETPADNENPFAS